MKKYYFYDELEKEKMVMSELEAINWAQRMEDVIEEEQAEEVNNIQDALRLMYDIHNVREITKREYLNRDF